MQSLCMSGIGKKQVINVCDGAVLGFVTDIEIDKCDGRVTAFIIGCGSALGFSKGDAVRIPWCNVKCIGEDAILVDIVPCECKCQPSEDKKKKKFNKIL